jgi:quercetin dioxygenase-like cupin family protein
MDLQKVVECSPDTPVKKDLIRMRGSNIVVVCLEAGQEIPPHPEPYAVVFVVLKGEGIITAGKVRHPVKPLHLISVEKDQDRGIRCDQRMVILGIRDEI